MSDQLNMFDDQEEAPNECCYKCSHFAEFKQPKTYSDRNGEFSVFGICFKAFYKNGSYSVYPIYIPNGKCKSFKKCGGKKR